jgi:hypothetical protein
LDDGFLQTHDSLLDDGFLQTHGSLLDDGFLQTLGSLLEDGFLRTRDSLLDDGFLQTRDSLISPGFLYTIRHAHHQWLSLNGWLAIFYRVSLVMWSAPLPWVSGSQLARLGQLVCLSA